MKIRLEGKEVEVEKIYDKGWEGIVLYSKKENQYYLYDLLWHGGGYVDRFLKISRDEYLEFESLEYPDAKWFVLKIAERIVGSASSPDHAQR